MIAASAGWIDQILSRLVLERRFVSRRASSRKDGLTETIRSVTALREDDWFGTPCPLQPNPICSGEYRGHRIKNVFWELPEVRAGIALNAFPRTGPPQMTLRGSQGRRVWLLLPGWLSGGQRSWFREWPLDWLLEHADVAALCLPGHGPRRSPRSNGWPSFPTRNPLANAIGLALATAELRQAVEWFRASGYEQVLVAATSLGANIAALYATVAPDCDRLLLDRPLVRMSEPLHHVADRCGEPYLALASQLDSLYRPVSPLHRSLRLERHKVTVLLGHHDRIADSVAGARLAAHFAVEPEYFQGGHVLPLGRRAHLLGLLRRLTESDVDRTL